MLRCKDVAKALFNKNYEDLNKLQKCGLMVHVVLCPFCGRYHKDVVDVQKTTRAFSEQDEIGEDLLPEESKLKMRAVVKEALDDDTHKE